MTGPVTTEALAEALSDLISAFEVAEDGTVSVAPGRIASAALLNAQGVLDDTHIGPLAGEISDLELSVNGLEAALQQVTAERDGWKSTLRYCEREWQDERGTMLAKIAAANAEVARLQSALKEIADACPVTCDMSLAHDMAATAEHALARAATAREGA